MALAIALLRARGVHRLRDDATISSHVGDVVGHMVRETGRHYSGTDRLPGYVRPVDPAEARLSLSRSCLYMFLFRLLLFSS